MQIMFLQTRKTRQPAPRETRGAFTRAKAKLLAFAFSGFTLRSLPLKDKTPTAYAIGVLVLKPGSDLLSHGETPHYHRRYIVSLLSSGWDQVVPMLYCRRANWLVYPTWSSIQIRFNRSNKRLSQAFASPIQAAVTPEYLGVIWSSLTGN